MTRSQFRRRLSRATQMNFISLKIFHFLSTHPTPQMLDRESKREKILEGKLREIKIKLKKQQEQEVARATAELLARQAEKAAEEVKATEEAPKIIPTLSEGIWKLGGDIQSLIKLIFL